MQQQRREAEAGQAAVAVGAGGGAELRPDLRGGRQRRGAVAEGGGVPQRVEPDGQRGGIGVERLREGGRDPRRRRDGGALAGMRRHQRQRCGQPASPEGEFQRDERAQALPEDVHPCAPRELRIDVRADGGGKLADRRIGREGGPTRAQERARLEGVQEGGRPGAGVVAGVRQEQDRRGARPGQGGP